MAIYRRTFLCSLSLGATTFARRLGVAATLIASVLVSSALAQSVSVYSRWLPAAEYQKEFDGHVRRKFYPDKVDGRNEGGVREFRGRFVPYPDGSFAFESRTGLSVEAFDARHAQLVALGYTLAYVQRFSDASGMAVQAVWTKLGTTQLAPNPGVEPQQRF